jgi:Na+/H+ antiporter NhaC
MIKNLIYYSIVACALSVALFYAVKIGEQVGKENYKHSKAMQLALESAYSYGRNSCLGRNH